MFTKDFEQVFNAYESIYCSKFGNPDEKAHMICNSQGGPLEEGFTYGKGVNKEIRAVVGYDFTFRDLRKVHSTLQTESQTVVSRQVREN